MMMVYGCTLVWKPTLCKSFVMSYITGVSVEFSKYGNIA